jgi:hypothetical protein
MIWLRRAAFRVLGPKGAKQIRGGVQLCTDEGAFLCLNYAQGGVLCPVWYVRQAIKRNSVRR